MEAALRRAPRSGDSPAASTPSEPASARAEALGTSSLLAAAGGFLDAFTYVGHGHVFANAMTGNVVLLGVEATSRDWHVALHHLPPIVMFAMGICLARGLQLPRARRLLPDVHTAVLVIEIVVLLGLAFLPRTTSDLLIISAIALTASMQVQTFRNVVGYTYNSTFTTGNLRTLSVALFDWRFAGRQAQEQREPRHAAAVFAAICAAFLLGAAGGGSTVTRFGNRALLFEVALLCLVLARVTSFRLRLRAASGEPRPPTSG